LAERDASRLLVLDRSGGLQHRRFRDLPELLEPGDLLVLNRTRVFPARLIGKRQSGGRVEVLLLRHLQGREWEALLRPGKRLRAEERIDVGGALEVRVLEPPRPGDAQRRVSLEYAPDDLQRLLEQIGQTPLPPYVRRPSTPADRERYQNVYARERRSVAAPTAGLHFTAQLLERLEERGVARAEVVLHVGPGTFRPVQVERVEDHRVDPERVQVPPETVAAAERARAAGRRVVAVGTTSARALEAATDPAGRLGVLDGETDLTILPGHRFRATDALVTNFHLPRSSLLLLVSALAGRERVLAAYAEALAEGYRFYSYGDAMLIR
jgi:S-adenosylmethionine:tRNA ribosyltransferase-isomerase